MKHLQLKINNFLCILFILITLFSFNFVNAEVDFKINYVSHTTPLITVDFPLYDNIILDGVEIYKTKNNILFKFDKTNGINNFKYVEQEGNINFIKIKSDNAILPGEYFVTIYGIDSYGNKQNYTELLIVDLISPILDTFVPDKSHFKFDKGQLNLMFNFSEGVIFNLFLDDQLVIQQNPKSKSSNGINIINDTYSLVFENNKYFLYGQLPNGDHKLKIEFWDYALNGKVIEEIDFFSFDGNFDLIPLNFPFYFINKSPAILKYNTFVNVDCKISKTGTLQQCPLSGEPAILTGDKTHSFNIIHNKLFFNTDTFKLCYYCMTSDDDLYTKENIYTLDNTKPVLSSVEYKPASKIVILKNEKDEFSFELNINTDDSSICNSYDVSTSKQGLTLDFYLNHDSNTISNLFKSIHNIKFNNLDDKKTYTKYIKCMNKAGLISNTLRVDFKVDSSVVLDFEINSPKEFVNKQLIDIQLTSSMESNCIYATDSGTTIKLNTENNFIHASSVSLGTKNEYNFTFTCQTSTQEKIKKLKLRFDNRPPKIHNVFFYDSDIVENGTITKLNKLTKNNIDFKINFTDNVFSNNILISHFLVNVPTNITKIISNSDFKNYNKNQKYEISTQDLENDMVYYIGLLAKDPANNSALTPFFKPIMFVNKPFIMPPKTCIDIDKDGFGRNCPKGPDCNDRDASLTNNCISTCLDKDGDGFGLGLTCTGLDCDDTNKSLNIACTNGCTIDMDGDQYGINCNLGDDCDDTNNLTHENCLTNCFSDIDGDGYGLGCILGDDCDETNILIHKNCANGCFSDNDVDTYGEGCDAGLDCDDTNNLIHENCPNGCIQDADGDGNGLNCTAGDDCNGKNPLLAEVCIESGCVIDSDGDKYGWECTLGPDCNDLNPTIHYGCTNLCVYDFDADGLGLGCKNGPDCDEGNINFFANSCQKDCKFDADCDGIDDSWESIFGSNPNVKDQDKIILGFDKKNIDIYRNYPITPPEPGTELKNQTIKNQTVVQPLVEEEFNPIWYILIIVLLFIILGAGGYMIYRKQNPPEIKQTYSDTQNVPNLNNKTSTNSINKIFNEKPIFSIPNILEGDKLKSKWEEEILTEQKEKYKSKLENRKQLFSKFVNRLEEELESVKKEKKVDFNKEFDEGYLDLKDLVSGKKKKSDLKLPKSAFMSLDKMVQKHGSKINFKDLNKISSENKKVILDLMKMDSKNEFVKIDDIKKESDYTLDNLQKAIDGAGIKLKTNPVKKLSKIINKNNVKFDKSSVKNILNKSNPNLKNTDYNKILFELKNIVNSDISINKKSINKNKKKVVKK